MIGTAKDTTIFTYGPLTAGNPAAVRPIQVRDPNGDQSTVTYSATQRWNTTTHVRNADNATTTSWYSVLGRVDSVIDPVGIRSGVITDLAGRVTHQRVGTGTKSPTTRMTYSAGGLVTQTEVYEALPEDMTQVAPGAPIQATRSWYNRLGQVDSIAGVGTRTGKQARLQSFRLRDAFGNPTWSYGGNGSYVNRMTDWQGRLVYLGLSYVDPNISVDGEPFADGATKTFYQGLTLSMGKHLRAGSVHAMKYDNKGQLSYSESRDLYLGSYMHRRRIGYTRTNQVRADTSEFTDSLSVVRAYEYNRRGQRTLAADTVRRLPSGALLGEGTSRTFYFYNDTTARLDSTVAEVDSAGSPSRVDGAGHW